jgi:Resolvase, N terminal domain
LSSGWRIGNGRHGQQRFDLCIALPLDARKDVAALDSPPATWLKSAGEMPISFMRKLNAIDRAMGEVIGYARVSTDGQSVHDQMVQLKAAGATRIFSEKMSGARSDRPMLRKALAALSAGDTLLVVRLDRLSIRSTRSPRRARPSRGWAIRGPTPLRRMVG